LLAETTASSSTTRTAPPSRSTFSKETCQNSCSTTSSSRGSLSWSWKCLVRLYPRGPRTKIFSNPNTRKRFIDPVESLNYGPRPPIYCYGAWVQFLPWALQNIIHKQVLCYSW
ncbi:unnamed protein product, partial [Amoebophrya sp. A25]